MRRLTTLLTLNLLGCVLSDDGQDKASIPPVTPDDVELRALEQDPGGRPGFLVATLQNNSALDLDVLVLRVQFLDNGQVVLVGTATFFNEVTAGATVMKQLLWDRPLLPTYSCYTYQIEIVLIDEDVIVSENYPGTCN